MIDALQNGGSFLSTTTNKTLSETEKVSDAPILKLMIPDEHEKRYSIRAAEAR